MPTAVESYAKLGAVLVHLPQTPASHVVFEPNNNAGNIGGRSSELLPAVQTQRLIGLLRPAAQDASAALAKVLPASQKMIEVIGLGTSQGIIAILIGLLRDRGFHATIASCDGSVRPGFPGPSAVLRAHGGAVAGQFLQQLAAARALMGQYYITDNGNG